MTKERIIFFLLIIVLLFFPITMAIKIIITKQNEEDTKAIRLYYSKETVRTYDDMKKILGEPNYIYQKEDQPVVEYKMGKVSNRGFVAIWDTKKWYGKGYIIISSFDRNTKKQASSADSW